MSKNIRQGSTLSNDLFIGERFHYGLSNLPFGKKWEKDKAAVERKHKLEKLGRDGPGRPKISDGSMLSTRTAEKWWWTRRHRVFSFDSVQRWSRFRRV